GSLRTNTSLTVGTNETITSTVTGTALTISPQLTSGVGLAFTSLASLTTGSLISSAGGNISGTLTPFTGKVINLATLLRSADNNLTDTGNFLNFRRNNEETGPGNTFTVAGD